MSFAQYMAVMPRFALLFGQPAGSKGKLIMETSVLGLSYRPLGIEHPYHQEPDERFPRRPLAGQPVALGVRTWPPEAALRVWVTWVDETRQAEQYVDAMLTTRGGDAEETMTFATSMVRLGDSPPGDTWRVELPPFAAGQQVTYSLHAADAAGQIDSPDYSFTVLAWTPAGRRTAAAWPALALKSILPLPAGWKTAWLRGWWMPNRLSSCWALRLWSN